MVLLTLPMDFDNTQILLPCRDVVLILYVPEQFYSCFKRYGEIDGHCD